MIIYFDSLGNRKEQIFEDGSLTAGSYRFDKLIVHWDSETWKDTNVGSLAATVQFTLADGSVVPSNPLQMSISNLQFKQIKGYDSHNFELNRIYRVAEVEIPESALAQNGVVKCVVRIYINSQIVKSLDDISFMVSGSYAFNRDISESEYRTIIANYIPKAGGYVNGSLKPSLDGEYDLGEEENAWNDVFAKAINLDAGVITSINGDISIQGADFAVNTAKVGDLHATRFVDGNGNAVQLSYVISTIASAATHIASTSNPHNVTKAQVGLGNVSNVEQLPLSQKGTANGVATLDAQGKVPSSQLPDTIGGQLAYLGTYERDYNGEGEVIEVIAPSDDYISEFGPIVGTYVSFSEFVSNIIGSDKTAGSYFLLGTDEAGEPFDDIDIDITTNITIEKCSTGDWIVYNGKKTGTPSFAKIDNTDAVTGVKGSGEETYRKGNVSISASNIGLGNVNNTSDLNKPVSTATQTALDGKADKSGSNSFFGTNSFYSTVNFNTTANFSGSLLPVGYSSSLGSSSSKFAALWLSGSVSASNIKDTSGNVVFNYDADNAYSYRHFLPNGTKNLGTSSSKWRNAYLNGTVRLYNDESEEESKPCYVLGTTDDNTFYIQDIYQEDAALVLGESSLFIGRDFLPLSAGLDIGNSSSKWNDLYLSGSLYAEYIKSPAGNAGIWVKDDDLLLYHTSSPSADNTHDLGKSNARWKDIYVSGALKDGTNSLTLAQIQAGLGAMADFPTVPSTNRHTLKAVEGTMKFVSEGNVSTSAATTFSGSVSSDTEYVFTSQLTSLSITAFSVAQDDNSPCWMISFIAGANISVSLPTGSTWADGDPTFTQGMEYRIIAYKGIASNTYRVHVIED